MRLGGPVFRWEDDPELFARRHQEKGYQAATCPKFLKAGDTALNQKFLQEMEKRDIIVAEVGAWSNPLSPDRKEAEKNIAYMTERLALAEEMNAKTCVNVVGSGTTETWYGPDAANYTKDFFDHAVDVTRRIIDAVHPKRTRLSFEIMPYSFLDGPEEYLQFIKSVDRPAVGVHFDPCNCVNSPRRYYHLTPFLERCFDLLGDKIVSIHLKDIKLLVNRITVVFEEVPIGCGGMDYLTLLRRINRLPQDTPAILEHLNSEEEYDAAATALRNYAVQADVRI